MLLMKATPLWLCLALLPAGVRAQNALDHWESFYNGPGAFAIHVKTETIENIPGQQAMLSSSSVAAYRYGVAFRMTRLSAGSLWIEFPWTSISPVQTTTLPPNSITRREQMMVPGLRYMVPVERHHWGIKRFPIYNGISVYAAAGAGLGFFDYPVIAPNPQPSVFLNSTTHGVFDFGGGIEVRILGLEGIRFDVRDMVTGRGLSGVAGRNHLVPTLEWVFHL